jgi:hypothetical protein
MIKAFSRKAYDCGVCPVDPNFGGALSNFEKSGSTNRKAIARHLRKHRSKYVKARRVHIRTTQDIRHFPGHALMGLVTKFVAMKAKIYGKVNIHAKDIIVHMLSVFSTQAAESLQPAVKLYYLSRLTLAVQAAT